MLNPLSFACTLLMQNMFKIAHDKTLLSYIAVLLRIRPNGNQAFKFKSHSFHRQHLKYEINNLKKKNYEIIQCSFGRICRIGEK